jgi:hypothetical protein
VQAACNQGWRSGDPPQAAEGEVLDREETAFRVEMKESGIAFA